MEIKELLILRGIFCLVPVTSACLEAHTMILPAGRGNIAASAVKLALRWIWDNAPNVQRIVTQVPDHNRPAYARARIAGMTEYGHNPNSYIKNGRLMGVHLLGVSRCQ